MNQGSTTLICNKQQKTSFVHNKTMIFLETMTLIGSNNNSIMTSEIMKWIQIIVIQMIITTMAQHFMMIGRLCSIISYAQIYSIKTIQSLSMINMKYNSLRDRGPDVDEFGNPLDDIHSTDTTRFELGTGGDLDARKCPRHWYQFRGSCYKFTRSPELGRDEASELCREYRHQATVLMI